MKLDMHCHTKAGSIDAKVPLDRYMELLKEKGFDGMLVTDHDSYRGYRKWFMSGGGRRAAAMDFTVLCGIEYDTRDAGHFIVILPGGIMPPILRVRGMSVRKLITVVHMLGGVLGPAHPFGTRSASAMFFKKFKADPKLMEKMDFVEGFNTCESSNANMLAVELAEKYGKPCIGGSDSHEERYIGMAYTEFEERITCNNDLINAIRQGRVADFGGQVREQTAKAKHKEAFYSVWGFKAYNRGLGFIFSPLRKIHSHRGHH